MKTIKTSFKIFFTFTILTGVFYPILITIIGQSIFPSLSNGSLIFNNNKIIGSILIGQSFDDAKYFHGRPSAINYNPFPSGASNFGLSNKLLNQEINKRVKNFRFANFLADSIIVPSEMIFSSGSGVDPHISVTSAKLQITRILKSRNISEKNRNYLNSLIDSQIENRQFGIWGNEVVNVLKLNLKLDEESKKWTSLNYQDRIPKNF